MIRHLKLYIRSGCSLCEEMQWELTTLAARVGGFTVDAVDVDSEEGLKQTYGHKVPVLTSADGDEICHYFLDRQALDSYFLTH